MWKKLLKTYLNKVEQCAIIKMVSRRVSEGSMIIMSKYLVHLEVDMILEAEKAAEAENIVLSNIDYCLAPAPDCVICEAIPYNEGSEQNE